jgi:hypothetical protein
VRRERTLAACSRVAADGGRWLLTAVPGHLGDTYPTQGLP